MNQKSGLLVLLGVALMAGLIGASGCTEHEPKYGVERAMTLPSRHGEIWAVAPAVNLSGYHEVDPYLQADLLFAQLQEVRGLTVIPVNRVAEVFASLKIEKIQSPADADRVCAILGCDRLVVPTITAYDPYAPPKVGASLQVIGPKKNIDDGARQASATMDEDASFIQAVGIFDAANGSVRDALLAYAAGRNDPVGPMGPKEYFASIDRYCGFVYHQLIEQVLLRKSWDEWKR